MATIPELIPRSDWALFLDIDGTLLDLAETPTAVVVPNGLLSALVRAGKALDGALALVSGRAVADIDTLFHPVQFPAAGIHGFELRPRTGAPRRVAPLMSEEQRLKLAGCALGLDGVIVEDKAAAVGLHYRLAPDVRDVLARRIEAVLAEEDLQDFSMRPGKMLWEVRRNGIDKGKAVEAFMASRPFAGRVPVFVGDDETDLDGFAGARRLGGFALPVRDLMPGPGFAGPPEVRAWLAELPSHLEKVTA
ncbi:MAG: trehalose-phosphatase [Alphaproteobacteria bacterium]|nr:trehalose-phosphatase [Alphaproteobacteria bacterium]